MSAATPSPVRSRRREPLPPLTALSTTGAPRYLQGLVGRPDLVDRLTGAEDARLAVLIAPPGYGKTSLLREWSEHDERPFVWLCAADLPSAAAIWTRPPAGAPVGDDDPVVLAVDDAHLVHPVMLAELVESVLPQLPPRSILALACRAEPALPLGRLRAHHELIELRESDLALTTPEVGRVLLHAGLDLDDPGAVEAIARRTEGWPVGAYLATLALRGRDDLADRARQFGGSNHLVAEYLHDEVLSAVSAQTLSFMVRSSVLKELSGPACDAVLEREGSARTLTRLARTNLFLRPADSAHERFCWHPMFREALASVLRRTEPERLPELHHRAGAWLHARGDLGGAIDHAVAAGDAGRAGELISRNIVSYLGRGETATVQQWLRGFSDERIAEDAGLALVAAHVALAEGDANRAQRWRLVAAPPDDAPEAAGGPSLQAGVALVEALSPRAGLDTMEAAASRAYELEGEGGQWRPLTCLLRGVALHLGGSREAAIEVLEEGIQCARDLTPLIGAISVAQRSAIAVEADDWETAAELTDRALSELDRCGLADEPSCAIVYAAAAATRARSGRSDEAKRDLRRGIDLLTELGDFVPWYGAETRILLAQASLGLADIVRARTLLAEASRYARRCQDVALFTRWLDDAWAHIDTLAETSLSGPSSLTIAELRILRFLPSHRSFKEIAVQLGVSANTVKTQAHAVYRKLGAASRSEAVARASQAGLLGQ
jgi:LuxR family transcriptional regulator, maltose regulon positive regulatory protein